jgi:hypothetical protein
VPQKTGSKPQLGKVRAQKSPLTQVNRRARKAGRSVRTFLRFIAVVAAFVAGLVYWNFGTLSPCGVLREAIRQGGDLVAIFPDGVIDFGFEAQFGEMSANRCFAVLLENLTSPVPTTEQASQSLSMQAPAATRNAKVVAKRSQVSSIRTLSTAAIDQIVGAKATARLVLQGNCRTWRLSPSCC